MLKETTLQLNPEAKGTSYGKWKVARVGGELMKVWVGRAACANALRRKKPKMPVST